MSKNSCYTPSLGCSTAPRGVALHPTGNGLGCSMLHPSATPTVGCSLGCSKPGLWGVALFWHSKRKIYEFCRFVELFLGVLLQDSQKFPEIFQMLNSKVLHPMVGCSRGVAYTPLENAWGVAFWGPWGVAFCFKNES